MFKKISKILNASSLKAFATMSFLLSLVLANSTCFFWEYDGEDMPESVKSMRR